MFSEGFRYKILQTEVWGNRLDPPDLGSGAEIRMRVRISLLPLI